MSDARPPAVSDAARKRDARWLIRRLFEVVPVDVVERDLTEPIPAPREVAEVEIRRLDPAASEEWRGLVPAARRRAVGRFAARGDYGYLALAGGELVGELWVCRATHRDGWSGLRIRLADDEAYLHELSVDPRYRPAGLPAAIVARALLDLREEGVGVAYGWVEIRNRLSQALLRMVFGFRQVQQVKRAHFFGFGVQVPFSARPRFGPVSPRGRHSAR